jgi:hypothetical protein
VQGRKGTCGTLAFTISSELTAFLQQLDAADDEEARTDAQHQLHTAGFTATTTGGDADELTGTVQWLHGKALAHSCAGAVGFLSKGTCGALVFTFSPELTAVLQRVKQADDEERSELQRELHGKRFRITTTGDNVQVFDGTAQVLQGKLPAAYSNSICAGPLATMRNAQRHVRDADVRTR